MNEQRLEKDVQHLRDTELRCTGWKQEGRNESNVWTVFAGVHATGRGEE